MDYAELAVLHMLTEYAFWVVVVEHPAEATGTEPTLENPTFHIS